MEEGYMAFIKVVVNVACENESFQVLPRDRDMLGRVGSGVTDGVTVSGLLRWVGRKLIQSVWSSGD
jgi:hypothetical protein